MKRFALALVLALTACDESPEARRARSLAAPIFNPVTPEALAPQKQCPEFSELSQPEQTMVQNRRVIIGMRPIAVICMKGNPLRVFTDRTASGEKMTYIYPAEAVVFSAEGTVSYVSERF